jgi:long-chain acyl-CoA synthetase
MGVNVAQFLRQWALRAPDRVAVVDRAGERAEVTYGELDGRARRFAAWLEGAGITPGDRVALLAANDADFVAAFMGIAYAGAVVVLVPILSAPPEVRFRIQHAGCRVLVHDRARLALAREAAEGSSVTLCESPLIAPGGQIETPADLPPDATAMILYTSGTTGAPKGACITHASLATHTAAIVHHVLGFDAETRVLGVLPLTHSYGVRMTLLAPFYAGGRVVLLPRFEARRALEVAREERVTWLPAVPTMLAGLAAVPPSAETAPWPELGGCLSAGAPLPEDVRARAEARLGAEIRQGYGLTEATFTTIDARPDAPRPGTVGRAVFGVEVAIVDDAGARVPAGVSGEVVVRGQNVMARYLDDDAGTAAAFRDGWLCTGDVGHLDADGALTIIGRTKDLILRGGQNVYPSEVEAVLDDHPDVAEAAVVGIPHAYYGEEVVAVLRLEAGAALDRPGLDAFCRARLAAYKVPRAYALVDGMPLGPSHKVQKRTLRKWLQDGILTPEG